ncbi:MAG: DUF4174 domain-containing protein [Rhodobacteraceae bacterium]|nr:DUF4174 domain-containing protein [Paracoccaceae bacterium]
MAHGDEDQEPVTGGVPSADLPEQEPEQELAVIDMTLPERVGLGVDEYRWINRLVVVFADSGSDPRFREQMTFLREDEGDLLDRDVVVLVDTNPAAESALRLRYRPRGFVVLLVGKDGALALRKPVPWNVRALRNAIDKLPVRQQEMKGG